VAAESEAIRDFAAFANFASELGAANVAVADLEPGFVFGGAPGTP